MARTGLYKSEVKKARDTLLAQNKYPSVDAVRIELGNTGSKSTIHKYLKELEIEDGGANRNKIEISEALQNLVSSLANQLQAEANTQVDEIRMDSAAKEQQHIEQCAVLHVEIEALSNRVLQSENERQQEKASHQETQAALQQETITRHTLMQEVTDLKIRLEASEIYRLSLEEKHQHTRDALEHYRQSIKEQREQDQRRHEQQIQQLQAEMRQLQQTIIVKQDELTRQNQECTRLSTNLTHANKSLEDERTQRQELAQQLHSKEQKSMVLESRVVDKETLIINQNKQLDELTKENASLTSVLQGLRLELIAAQVKLETQNALTEQFRELIQKVQIKL